MTASVSEDELAVLIASFAPGPPSTGGPAPEPRCTVTELLTAQCAHCRPAPPSDERETALGLWFAATYKGTCSGCGARFEVFDEIRSDGEGGWLAACCGNVDDKPAAPAQDRLIAPAPALLAGTPYAGVTATVAAIDDAAAAGASAPWAPGEREQLLAAPPVLAGPPTSTIKELRQVLIDFEAQRPRSMQKALGPSELGTPCQQQMARKLAGAPRKPIVDPTWAPFQGTAVHASMEQVVAHWNTQLGRTRWLAEDRLEVDPGLPGVDGISGNGDAFDQDWAMVVDWKHTGKTAREKLARAKRMGKPPAQQVSAEYRIQGHLYGYGHARKGRDVRWVRLVLLARSHDYDESQEWTEEYDPAIAIEAIARYYATHDVLNALGGTQAGDLIAAVPATPHRDTCKWCPFLRPGQPSNWAGCPGDQPLDRIVERATSGLIAPTQ